MDAAFAVRLHRRCGNFRALKLEEPGIGPVIRAIAVAGGQGWFPNFLDATPENIASVKGAGMKIGAWTVNETADMRRLMDLDADMHRPSRPPGGAFIASQELSEELRV